MLIQHSDFLLNQTQKFAAIILCYELYRNEPIATNPLAPIFMHLLVRYNFVCNCVNDKHLYLLHFIFSIKKLEKMNMLVICRF